MNEDLKIIRKNYGEKMMHLCRELFPTLLEKSGLLSKIIMENFAPSKFLYEDIVATAPNVDSFQEYIYQLSDMDKDNLLHSSKSPKELLADVGYDLFVCKTEEDIQKFRKYYKKGEELCTFTQGNRLNYCQVFFAVKKDVEKFKREDFISPRREDDYGISVISIQFSRGKVNTLSIKNRYNHTVPNPDATFSNNLENIIPGLTESFQREYNLNINQNDSKNFNLQSYVKANDGKFYKYNYEKNNIYYCPNNIIIDNFEVKHFNSEQYVILDDFVLDLRNKKIELYDKYRKDSFVDGLRNIEKISIIKSKETNEKEIKIITKKGNEVIIEIDKFNRIISYKNNEITKVKDNFLFLNQTLEKLDLEQVRIIGDRFLKNNLDLEIINIPCLQRCGRFFLWNNNSLKTLECPNLIKVGEDFLKSNRILKKIYIPKLIEVGEFFLFNNNALLKFCAPSLIMVGSNFFHNNYVMEEIECPRLSIAGDDFLIWNHNIERIEMPSLTKVGVEFISHNRNLISANFPKLQYIGNYFLEESNHLKYINIPKLTKKSIVILNEFLKNIEIHNQNQSQIENNSNLYNSKIKNIKNSNQSLIQSLKKKLDLLIDELKNQIGGKFK